MAVVVQRMAPDVRCAGVVFTANPVTGLRGEIVIEAVAGLAEGLVSGALTPQRVTVPPGGGDPRWSEEDGPLTADDVATLCAAAMRVQADVGAGTPQDIEWCLGSGPTDLWLVQSRPITTLYPLPEGYDRARDGPRVWAGLASSQGTVDPFTPFGFDSYLRTMFRGGRDQYGLDFNWRSQDAVVLAGGRLFANSTILLTNPVTRSFGAGIIDLDEVDPVIGRTVREIEDEPAFQEAAGWSWAQVSTIGLTIRAMLYAVLNLVPSGLRILAWPQGVAEASYDRLRRDRARLRDDLASRDSLADLLRGEQLDLLLGPSCSETNPLDSPGTVVGMLTLQQCRTFAPEGRWRDDYLTVSRSLPWNPTSEMGHATWRLAKVCAGEEDDGFGEWLAGATVPEIVARFLDRDGVPRPVLVEYDAFMDEYGYRACAEIDMGVPRFRDDPTPILASVRSLVQLARNPDADPSTFPPARHAAGLREADEWVAGATAELRRRYPWTGGLRVAILNFFVARCRALGGLREFLKFRMVTLFGIVRQWVAERATLEFHQVLDDPAEDVFWLRHEEIVSGDRETWRELVRQRRAQAAVDKRITHLPNMLVGDGRAFFSWSFPEVEGGEGGGGGGGESLTGSGVSAGRVSGRAYVVVDPTETEDMRAGDILVTRCTDPSWTPLLMAAGGLVLEVGGTLTHGSVAAREYGIPAVVGVSRAATIIRSGDQLIVDGSTGRVTIVREEGEEEEEGGGLEEE